MSLAGEMRKLADSKQPELTLEEKHKIIQYIKDEASKGLYKASIECNGKYHATAAYLAELGFQVNKFIMTADNEDVLCLQIDWGDVR